MWQYILGFISLVLSFVVTFFLTKFWIKIAKRRDLVGRDMHKMSKPEIAESGGIAVVSGISLSLILYVFFKIFLISTKTHLIETFALMTTILVAVLIGFIDDILGWKEGLEQWQKVLFTLPIPLPIMAINAGQSLVNFPITIDLGVFYPLLVIPIGIIGASNGFNLLAGFNGLEARQGSLLLAGLFVVTFFTDQLWLSLVCLSSMAALLAFLFFNEAPSSVFGGDSLTYPIGALIATICILGNLELFGIIIFLPYYVEFLLKMRGRFNKESFCDVVGAYRSEKLKCPHDKVYSINHIVAKFIDREELAVLAINYVQIIIIFIGLFLIF